MTTSLTLAIVLVGLIGYVFLPVAALPKVDFPTISVSTSLPGASPSTIAASIASPLEREFGAIAGVDSITSVSGLGIGRITCSSTSIETSMPRRRIYAIASASQAAGRNDDAALLPQETQAIRRFCC
jgi:multidrug efflux pump subunit AcrB